ncbi:MAG: acetylornithine deacetylase, partial [Alphaproteobacteria bacterium]|nr:acetylornithine deacetylase [Alphaproteobacteria bacterium]
MPAPSTAAVEMIRRLVGFDTTSRDSNLPLIEYVKAYLAENDVASELVYDPDRRKANLFATIGPTDRPGLVLSGHTDVVPVDGQEWVTDPFATVEKDGRLYGRGTCDMKSFVAVVLAMVPEIKRSVRASPVHLAFSYDEEVGCIGVRRMLDVIANRPVRPYACIVGEPTEMKVVRAHKGKLSIRAHVRGFECHSSLAPHGVNAVQYAAEFIANLNGIGKRLATDGSIDREFDVPYTTVHTGVIHGGTALNIVPKDCWFNFEFRHLPADDPRALLEEAVRFARRTLEPAMHGVQRDTGFRFEESSS